VTWRDTELRARRAFLLVSLCFASLPLGPLWLIRRYELSQLHNSILHSIVLKPARAKSADNESLTSLQQHVKNIPEATKNASVYVVIHMLCYEEINPFRKQSPSSQNYYRRSTFT